MRWQAKDSIWFWLTWFIIYSPKDLKTIENIENTVKREKKFYEKNFFLMYTKRK